MSNLIRSCILALAVAGALSSGERAPVRPVNLNTATLTELMQLPRVGLKTAERIVSFRKQHGGFQCRIQEFLRIANNLCGSPEPQANLQSRKRISSSHCEKGRPVQRQIEAHGPEQGLLVGLWVRLRRYTRIRAFILT